MNTVDKQCVFLNPGEITFGQAPLVVSTLLGSCVSAVIWNPYRQIGGMCHVVLPEKHGDACDNKYAECAIEYFLRNIYIFNSNPIDYQVRLFGGGNMFPQFNREVNEKIGDRNIKTMCRLLKEVGFNLNNDLDDVGGISYRRLTFYVSTGEVILKSKEIQTQAELYGGENA